jgi:hypothetical protein
MLTSTRENVIDSVVDFIPFNFEMELRGIIVQMGSSPIAFA